MENQEYHHVLKDIVFSDGIFLFHVLDIFVGNSRYHISNYSIPVSTEVFDRAVELTKESEEN